MFLYIYNCWYSWASSIVTGRHRRAASRSRRAARHGLGRQPLGGLARGVAVTDGAPDHGDPGLRSDVALRDRRARGPPPETSPTARFAVLSTCTTAIGPTAPGHRRALSPIRNAPATTSSPSGALVPSVRMPGAGIRSAVLFRQRSHPAGSLGDPLAGHAARPDGGDDGGVHLGLPLLVGAPNRDRAGHSRPRGPAPPPRGRRAPLAPTMSSASDTMTPSNPSSCAAHRRTLLRQRRRDLRVDRLHDDVGSHDAGDAGIDSGPEGLELALIQHLARHGDARQPVVRVDDGVTVAREVLGAGRNAHLLQPRHPRRRVPPHGSRRDTEASRR